MRLILPIPLILILSGCVTALKLSPLRLPASPDAPSVYTQFFGLASAVVVESGTDADLKIVAGFEQEVWVLGDEILLRKQNQKFLVVDVPVCPKRDFKTLSVKSAEDVRVGCTLVTGQEGYALFDGHGWTAMAESLPTNDQRVWEDSKSDVWKIEGKSISRFDGKDWSPAAESGAHKLNAISGARMGATPTVWVAGDHGELLIYESHMWQDVQIGTDENLSSVWAGPGGVAWIVGEDGLIIRAED